VNTPNSHPGSNDLNDAKSLGFGMYFFATNVPPETSKNRAFLTRMRLSCLSIVLMCLLTGVLPASAVSRISSDDRKDVHAAADAAHLRVELLVPAENLHKDGKRNEAGLYFKLEPGWHVYWKNAGDSGEPPHMHWVLPNGISAGPLEFPAPKRLPLGPLMDFGYEDEVLFPFSIDIAKAVRPGPVDLHAKVDWLVCREVCIPGKAELDLRRNVSDHPAGSGISANNAALFKRFQSQLPRAPRVGFKAVFQPSSEGFRLAIITGQHETTAAFFPADQNILDNPAPQPVTPTAKGLVLDVKKDANLSGNPSQLRGVLELSGGRALELTALPGLVPRTNAPTEQTSVATTPTQVTASPLSHPASPLPAPLPPNPLGLFREVSLAFLGGLLLNLMPCVFPVLFIKGLALVQSGSEERHKLRAHGFVYAAGILASFWALVAVLFGLSAAGSHLGWGFQFQSPIFLVLIAGLLFFLGLSLAGQFEIGLSLTSTGGSLAARQGYTGSFFTGVLAVVVATPCTAPLMGAAIGYALAQPPAVTFAVFTALALGLAAPYVALTLQPAWTRLLPRPGAWMEVLKQATAVPVFATVIWLAWVVAQAYGAAMLATLLVSLLLLAIAGWFLGRWPAKGWATSIAAVILAGVVGLGLLLPGKLQTTRSSNFPSAPGAWESWSAEGVSRYRAQGRPVFVDFTASWCLSCQVNERVALGRPEVKKAFEDANVALLRADWTQRDEAIEQALTALGRSGVPAYVLYSPGEKNPQLLPEVLTPGIVTDALGKLPHTASQSAAATSNLK
jgi:thiol:disulfide interchange protein/DsbC/DsbD-like thiol-disulfide interchange protein